jgi:hypothetical protein
MSNKKVSYSVTSQGPGQKLAPQNLKFNNVLPDLCYYTFHRAVIDEYGSNLEL